MGVDYCAYAVIGCRIEGSKLFRKEMVKTCYNKGEPKDVLFHLKTGVRLWEEEDVPVAGFDEDGGRLFGFPCIRGTDGDYFYVGLVAETGDGDGGDEDSRTVLDLETMSKYKSHLMAVLGDLFDEAEFGLWAVLYCSY